VAIPSLSWTRPTSRSLPIKQFLGALTLVTGLFFSLLRPFDPAVSVRLCTCGFSPSHAECISPPLVALSETLMYFSYRVSDVFPPLSLFPSTGSDPSPLTIPLVVNLLNPANEKDLALFFFIHACSCVPCIYVLII